MTSVAPFITGAASLEAGQAGGVVPHRLPAWARLQMEDALFSFVEGCTTGVSIRFRTSAATVTITMAAIAGAPEGSEPRPLPLVLRQGRTEQTIEGPEPTLVLLDAASTIVGRVAREPQQITLALHGTPDNEVELLLSHTAHMELIDITADAPLEPLEDQRLRWLHYGSSISQGMNAILPSRTWPVAAAHQLDWQLRNMSFAGNAQLDGFAARMIRESDAEFITLKVGINLLNADSMRERAFRPALHAFLDTIREGKPTTPIVLISALACPIHEESPGPVMHAPEEPGMMRVARRSVENDTGALTLRRTREIVEEVLAQRADPHLSYLDGRELFGMDDAPLLYDRLHPDQEGLDLIASRFVDRIRSFAPTR